MALQAPYFTPSLPFVGDIYGGLKEGMMVVISGSVQQSCKRFQIDFQCGSAPFPRPDIAFHFNPRLDEGCVVGNSLERGNWQREERKREMPFHKGHPFEIRVLAKSSSFKVAVDGQHFLDFQHRIPLSRVNAIGISGGVEVACIDFQGPALPDIWNASRAGTTSSAFLPSPNFPPACPQGAGFPPGPYFPPQTFSVPYRGPIFGGLFPSKSILISGAVPPNATRFHINLKAGNTVALHINPRFNENVIVRNSKLNECWGSEDRQLPSGMPLFRGQAFSIWILCEPHCFKVALNGQHLFDYNYRFHHLQQINQLEVEGDVTLTSVQLS